jgi:hypothetical protein
LKRLIKPKWRAGMILYTCNLPLGKWLRKENPEFKANLGYI